LGAGRQPLGKVCMEKCLQPVAAMERGLAAVQGTMNELQRLANVGVVSTMMDTVALTTGETPVFNAAALHKLWAHFQSELEWHGVVPGTSDPAPMLSQKRVRFSGTFQTVAYPPLRLG
jgi:hypothetical protein